MNIRVRHSGAGTQAGTNRDLNDRTRGWAIMDMVRAAARPAGSAQAAGNFFEPEPPTVTAPPGPQPRTVTVTQSTRADFPGDFVVAKSPLWRNLPPQRFTCCVNLVMATPLSGWQVLCR